MVNIRTPKHPDVIKPLQTNWRQAQRQVTIRNVFLQAFARKYTSMPSPRATTTKFNKLTDGRNLTNLRSDKVCPWTLLVGQIRFAVLPPPPGQKKNSMDDFNHVDYK